MYCRKCGSELPDGAGFCVRCGTRAQTSGPTREDAPDSGIAQDGAPSQSEPGREPLNDAQHAYQAHAETTACESTPRETPPPSSSSVAGAKRSRRPLVVTVSVLAVVAVIAAAGLWWKSDQDAKAAAQAAWDLAHTPQAIALSIEAPGFDESSTPIAVKVEGTDLDGNTVEEVRYLHDASETLSALAGSYGLSFQEGYLTGDGTVVRAPESKLSVTIDAPSDSGRSADASAADSQAATETAVFTEVPDLETTRELIDSIAEAAEQDPQDAGKARALSQRAQERREAALAEEEARKAAEAEAARIEERKGQIEQTAEDFLYYLFDNNGARGRSVLESRPSGTMSGFTNNDKSLQSGWPSTRMTAVSSLVATGENEVMYSLTYEYQDIGAPYAWHDGESYGRIAFGANGLIDQWYPDSAPSGRLI